jgi:hypothetical protein
MDKNVIVRTDEVFTKEILQTALKAIEDQTFVVAPRRKLSDIFTPLELKLYLELMDKFNAI